MIAIIEYGTGNLGSIANMLKKIGANSIITSKKTEIENADKIIFPGIGSFDSGMNNINRLGLSGILTEQVIKNKKPVLGICLGMQLFTKRSEEGTTPGLGWIDAETMRFRFDTAQSKLKIPHMGWNTITIRKQHTLFNNLYLDPRFYFVHSYHVKCHNEQDVLSVTFHGYDFVSSVQRENIIGVQFHPEKSHKFGMKLLKNFLEL